MGLYIPDFSKHYGKRKGRKNQFEKGIPNIMIPTSTNAKYRKLMKSPGGVQTFAVWIQILCYWGDQVGNKWATGGLWGADGMATIEEIAEARHLNPKAIRAAIPKLLELGWLEERCPDGQQAVPSWAPKQSKAKQREEKQNKEKKPPPPKVSYRDNVRLTEAEHAILLIKLGGQGQLDYWLDKLSGYKASNGKVYKSDYATWTGWGEGWWLKEGAEMFASKATAQPGKYANVGRKVTP